MGRWTQRVRWLAPIAGALTLVVWVASGRVCLGWYGLPPGRSTHLYVDQGRLSVARGVALPQVFFEGFTHPRWKFEWGFDRHQSPTYAGVGVPLWVFPIGFVALGVWAWWPRHFGPGRCERCGYDLAGLGPGMRCPECGTSPVPHVADSNPPGRGAKD